MILCFPGDWFPGARMTFKGTQKKQHLSDHM